MRLNTSFARAHAAALIIASSLATAAAAQDREPGRRLGAIGVAQVGIDNFGQVNPAYYRGAQPEGRDYASLASLGVKAVINLTGDDADASEETLAKGAGLRYFQIPMTTHRPPTSEQLAEFMRIVDDPANQPVFVHCVGGRHRTGVMTAAYRMTREGWTADRAYEEMKHYKFGPSFLHPEFKKFVYDFPAMLADGAPAGVPSAKAGG